jgi:hypothetical protein
LPAHWVVRISVDVFFIDSWDTETFKIFVDDELVISNTHYYSDAGSRQMCGNTGSLHWTESFETF